MSPAVDDAIKNISARMTDSVLACLFANSLPNTLDTTVYAFTIAASNATQDDAYVITGDIDAMWLRDSTNQVLPYLKFGFVRQDPRLKALLRGLVYRQTRYVLSDPFANAFQQDEDSYPSPHDDDQTTSCGFANTRKDAMDNQLVYERKYELDSLAAFLKLSNEYFEATGDLAPFATGTDWVAAVSAAMGAMRAMQADTGAYATGACPPYLFQRQALEPTDTLSHGLGFPGAAGTGLVRSMFRPSDDATKLPFLVPANAMAARELRRALPLLAKAGAPAAVQQEAASLASDIANGLKYHAVIVDRNAAEEDAYYAYEVDGYGNSYFMDDANIPSLLSLPLLGFCAKNDTLYRNTRKRILDARRNPYFFSGIANGSFPVEGVGGPHVGLGMIWPMGIMVRALTSDDDREIARCLAMLRVASADTGFNHESFWQGNPWQFTRKWFAWANSLFGELILTIARERPHLIFRGA